MYYFMYVRSSHFKICVNSSDQVKTKTLIKYKLSPKKTEIEILIQPCTTLCTYVVPIISSAIMLSACNLSLIHI